MDIAIEAKDMLRDPATIMNLERMGAMHQTRLSFARSLLRKMATEAWKLSIVRWDLDQKGFGVAIYQLDTPNQVYQQVFFTQYIADENRNDRVIATEWDCTSVLVEGKVDDALLAHLKANVPLQEAGRNTAETLVLTRANKSVRIFNHLVDSLAAGKQPVGENLAEVAYLLRTTAVYGNGKFGLADFAAIKENPDFRLSFSAQMCAVYILRQFSFDWLHYLAKQKGGAQAVELDRKYQRYLGTGNATGLGMSLYLIRHPKVVDQWLYERELALGDVFAQNCDSTSLTQFRQLLLRAQMHLQDVFTNDERQKALNLLAAEELADITQQVQDLPEGSVHLWHDIFAWTADYSLETQESVVSCLLELYPELVDRYEQYMNIDETYECISGLEKGQLLELLERRYTWALEYDFSKAESNYWFWYTSEDKEEPRLGVRHEDLGSELELPLDIARQIKGLYQALTQSTEEQSLADFMMLNPQFRTIIRRTWTMGNRYLGEIQANLIGKEMLPMTLLRAKLAMLGATKFDPRSDRWVRVTFFQGAPLFDELHCDDWLFPVLPKV